MQQDSDKFLGRGWAFPPTFHRSDFGTSGADMVDAREDIEQSLQILLSTSLGERIMRPDYGCNLTDFQFEPMNASVVGYIRDMVSTAMIYNEPRIRVERVEVNQPIGQPALDGKLLIEVDYTIRTTNSRFNFVYDFYITEGINS
ncbi:GPW/gp25 family protein [Spirosoma validum]|uniref:GPW/gp25 family protein n=1 Tax=Spirosoma validum TaxID=2771355 RepID=A0A927B0J6_9BACT|nr:GPW/gp25 family protein [Spirosoma validum]MBD2753195.1 GPW/gp25 family protein [Spirosoma validum]